MISFITLMITNMSIILEIIFKKNQIWENIQLLQLKFKKEWKKLRTKNNLKWTWNQLSHKIQTTISTKLRLNRRKIIQMFLHPSIKMNINMIMVCSRVNKHWFKLTQLIQLDSSLHQKTSNMMFHYKWNHHWL